MTFADLDAEQLEQVSRAAGRASGRARRENAYELKIRKIVDEWPTLSEQQRATLSALLRPIVSDLGPGTAEK